MLISYHGHSEFLLETENGVRVVTDPFDAHVGYPLRETKADICTVSHSHGDHAYTKKVTGSVTVLDAQGHFVPCPDVTADLIPSWHDDAQGKKRGPNLITKLCTDGLTITHLGDLGCPLNGEQLRAIAGTDILFIPVGGFYTIDAQQAARTVRQIAPAVVIPMHYKTAFNADWPIADIAPFLAEMGVKQPEPVPLLRVTKGDIVACPKCVVMKPEYLL